MKNNNQTEPSITTTIRAMAKGQYFDYPTDTKGGVAALHAAARQIGASVATSGESKGLKAGCVRVWLRAKAEKDGVKSTFAIKNGVPMPSGPRRGAPYKDEVRSAKAGKGKVASKASKNAKPAKPAPKAKAKPVKAKAKVAKAAKLTKAAPVKFAIAK